MDIRHLRYFVGIAECGSLMKASERLNVAQPTLSVHVANLEVELGVKLMERTNRGIELTVEGEALYQRATSLLRQYQDMVGSLKDMRKRPSGRVSVGMPSSLAPHIAAALYRKVSERLPDVTLYLAEASTAIVYEWLQADRLDFAILFNLPGDANLVSTPLQVEEFCLVSRPDRTNGADTIPFEHLFDRPLVVSCQSTTWRKALDDVALRLGRALHAPVETESAAAIKAIVLAGEASGLLPLSYVAAEVEQGTLKAQRIVDPEMRGLLAITHLPTLELNVARRAVRDLVIETVEESRAERDAAASLANVTPILKSVPSKILPGAAGGRRSARK
jgi:LysR family nitrogen assimilation transcriptional regulator